MKKRTMAVLLALLMLLPAVSCSETTNSDETNPSTESDTTETTPSAESEEEETDASSLEDRLSVPDDLPDIDYEDRSFRILAYQGNDRWGSYVDNLFEVWAEDQTGDTLNDSVYNRNLGIEDRFGVKIQVNPTGQTDQAINTSVQSNVDEYDLVGLLDYMAYASIGAKTLYNWLDVPYVNLEKPWHNKLANDGATINGRLFAECSDLAITAMTYTYAIFFNTNLMGNYGYSSSDLYSLVRENEWTIDKMIELVGEIYDDTNANGSSDEADLHGFGYYFNNECDVWLTAFDQPILSITDDGLVELSMLTDKTVAILEKLLSWHYDMNGFIKIAGNYGEENLFAENHLLMAPLRFNAAFSTLRTMESAYSMLPYPKWDTAQAGYYTSADDKFSVFGVPKTAYNNLDFVGTIYEALCAESYKTVYPKYYDEALKGRYSSEPETAEMVDLIMAGRKFDVAFQFGESYLQNLPYMMRYCMQDNDNGIASRYQKVQKAIKKSIETKLLPPYLDD